MATAMVHEFLRASASAGSAIFFAASSVTDVPYGFVSCCANDADAISAMTRAPIDFFIVMRRSVAEPRITITSTSMEFSFADHIGLLEHFLAGRQEIVDEIERRLLNV